MRILLTTLNTQYVHSNLALKYLYESAGIYRNMIQVKEYTINNYNMQIFLDIMMGKYDVICFSCYIWNISRISELIKDIKKANPEVKIVVGGPEVSFNPKEFSEKCPDVDYIIAGEGDRTFTELIQALVKNQAEGISKIIYSEPVPASDICFPYINSDIEKDKIIYYETSRGCPYRCSFCLSSVSRGVRLMTVDRVKKELDFFLSQNVKQVKFVDRTFNIDVNRSAEIMKYMVENDNGITNFHFELCGDLISEEMLQIFENARKGLFQVEIGVQSVHENVLKACDRKVDFEMLKKNTLRILKGRNVHVHLDLIAGLPLETYEMFKESFNCIYELQPDDLQLGFLKLLKGTKIRKESELYGYIYREKEPYEIISNNYISSYELISLKKVEKVLELYFNRGGFRNILRYMIERSGFRPFDFYMDFAEFFYGKSYHDVALSRNRLYEVLEEYIAKKKYDNSEGLKELLLYDKILTSSPSQFTDKMYSDMVHEHIRNTIDEDNSNKRAKDLIKKMNYMAFSYNVDEYGRSEGCELIKLNEKQVLLFYPENKDVAGQAFCERINY